MIPYEIKYEDFKNLIALAHSDELLSHEEMILIAEKALDAGLNKTQVDEILKNHPSLVFTIPTDEATREIQLADAVYLMMADGQIHDREYQICLSYAQRLELDASYIDHAIDLVKKLWEK